MLLARVHIASVKACCLCLDVWFDLVFVRSFVRLIVILHSFVFVSNVCLLVLFCVFGFLFAFLVCDACFRGLHLLLV